MDVTEKSNLPAELLEKIARNDNFSDKLLLAEVAELFIDKPDAAQYLYLYGELCEVMDDLVDEATVTPEMVDKAGMLRMKLGVSNYWLNNWQSLWMVERLIHNQYFDVVKWERNTEEWKRRDAKALSHCAYNMLFSVILLEFGDDKLKEISLRFREHAHLRHLNDPI